MEEKRREEGREQCLQFIKSGTHAGSSGSQQKGKASRGNKGAREERETRGGNEGMSDRGISARRRQTPRTAYYPSSSQRLSAETFAERIMRLSVRFDKSFGEEVKEDERRT